VRYERIKSVTADLSEEIIPRPHPNPLLEKERE